MYVASPSQRRRPGRGVGRRGRGRRARAGTRPRRRARPGRPHRATASVPRGPSRSRAGGRRRPRSRAPPRARGRRRVWRTGAAGSQRRGELPSRAVDPALHGRRARRSAQEREGRQERAEEVHLPEPPGVALIRAERRTCKPTARSTPYQGSGEHREPGRLGGVEAGRRRRPRRSSRAGRSRPSRRERADEREVRRLVRAARVDDERKRGDEGGDRRDGHERRETPHETADATSTGGAHRTAA